MNPLKDKVVLITGAKGGLGTTVTTAFLEAGATVIGTSRSIADSDFPHPRFSALPAELSSLKAATALLDAARQRSGRVDVVVHLVGAWAGGRSVEETDEATLERMLDLNLKSAFYLAGAAVPAMKEQASGKILAIGSRSAAEPAALSGAYNASKAALVMLIRTLAAEHSDNGISANIVLPGTMDTPANRAANPHADFRKWVQPEQVAAMLVHLASDEARQVNGAVIPIYGGDA
jgi:NAD(P)-dependent dehydrogenase (short-subunit alcohol dehydrogenase family)